MKNLLIIDIETAPITSLKKTMEPFLQLIPDTVKDADQKRSAVLEKAGLCPVSARIISIGVMQVRNFGTEHQECLTDVFIGKDEKKLLQQFADLFKLTLGWWMITFNGRGFDFPFLMFRSALHGIPLVLPAGLYNGRDNHIDMFVHLNDIGMLDNLYDKFKWVGLAKWQAYFGMPIKPDVAKDGTLAEWFRKGNYSGIADYNAKDVEDTFKIFDKFSGNFDLTPTNRSHSGVV